MVYIETLTAPFVCLGEIGVAVIVKTQVQLRSIRYSFFVMKSLIKEVCVRHIPRLMITFVRIDCD